MVTVTAKCKQNSQICIILYATCTNSCDVKSFLRSNNNGKYSYPYRWRMTSSNWWNRILRTSFFLTYTLQLILYTQDGNAQNAMHSINLYGTPTGATYIMEVDIGTYEERNLLFRLIVDTGSSNDAILGEACCSLLGYTYYTCSDSSTCLKGPITSLELAFAGATLVGHVVDDVWNVANNSIPSFKTDFVVIDEQGSFFSPDYDGITGLAYQALALPQDNPMRSFFDVLIAQGQSENSFGLLLCGIIQPLLKDSQTLSLHAGQLLIGGPNEVDGTKPFADPLLYTPIVQESWYVVTVTDVGFDGESLGLDCSSYNTPYAIIDSGTSNMAFPPDIYNELMKRIESATLKLIPDFNPVYFNYQASCCGLTYCDPSSAEALLLSLPSIYITLAQIPESEGLDVHTTNMHTTIEIPPEYYWRPELNGGKLSSPCRALGIAEGDSIVLGDVFMDGLYTFHDRKNRRLGISVADNCPNGVVSRKKVKFESKDTNWCDCFSKTQRKGGLLVGIVPWTSSACFFWQWWVIVVLFATLVILGSIGILIYWYLTGRLSKPIGTREPIHLITTVPQPSTYDNSNYERIQSPKSSASSIALLSE